jgi:hypothetical protein
MVDCTKAAEVFRQPGKYEHLFLNLRPCSSAALGLAAVFSAQTGAPALPRWDASVAELLEVGPLLVEWAPVYAARAEDARPAVQG